MQLAADAQALGLLGDDGAAGAVAVLVLETLEHRVEGVSQRLDVVGGGL